MKIEPELALLLLLAMGTPAFILAWMGVAVLELLEAFLLEYASELSYRNAVRALLLGPFASGYIKRILREIEIEEYQLAIIRNGPGRLDLEEIEELRRQSAKLYEEMES